MTDKDSRARIQLDMLNYAKNRLHANPSCGCGRAMLEAANRLAALPQPGEVTERQLAAAKRAYDAARCGGFHAEHDAMRAALTAALGAQTRGEGVVRGYNLRELQFRAEFDAESG